MTKEERITKMMKGFPSGRVPRHIKLAAEVLTNLAEELTRRGFRYREDPYWPWHLLVQTSPRRSINFYCGGFRKDIDVQQMKTDGTADTRFKGECFSTPRGVVNQLLKRNRRKIG